MSRHLKLLTIAVVACATMLGEAQAAHAKTEKVPTRGGHARFSEGGPRTTIQACDDRRDGKGVAVFVLEQERRGFVELVGAVDRRGKGTCGEVQQVGVATGDDLWVKVCLHDKSRVRKPVRGAFDPNLERCRTVDVGTAAAALPALGGDPGDARVRTDDPSPGGRAYLSHRAGRLILGACDLQKDGHGVQAYASFERWGRQNELHDFDGANKNCWENELRIKDTNRLRDVYVTVCLHKRGNRYCDYAVGSA
jgi:hypothetical protein